MKSLNNRATSNKSGGKQVQSKKVQNKDWNGFVIQCDEYTIKCNYVASSLNMETFFREINNSLLKSLENPQCCELRLEPKR